MELKGYHNFNVISEGQDRIIHRAIRTIDDESVILKSLRSEHPNPEIIALMYHEYEIAKDLQLDGVIKTFDLLDQENKYCLVLEDVQGISIKEYLNRHPLRNIGEFIELALAMVAVLGQVHQHNIIHKDIKPNNFIIEPKSKVIKLTDFNYSSKLRHEIQSVMPPSKLEGTLNYMAPEQTGRMNMHIDYRSDFYSLGVTFFEMLSGSLPYDYNDPLELLHAHIAIAMPELNNPFFPVPEIIGAIIEKLMAKDPGLRYQSISGLRSDLLQCKEMLEQEGLLKEFPLGSKDVIDRLNLSQKLYGREAEIKTLLHAYEQASQGEVVGLMICGYSGIGKTMLVNEVHKPMVQHKGYFISGKFDQLQRNTPYTALTQALNQLARLILVEPEERFKQIKQELLDALEGAAQLIITLAPDFELILGPQPELEKLPPKETLNRMRVFFIRFLKVVASKNHPLVLFIDDLQWIDSGTLNLLDYVLTDSELGHILFLGAYRENEVDEQHVLSQFLKKIKQTSSHDLQYLPLAPLTEVHFDLFFADSFARPVDVVQPFAALIHRRTVGNPFFCKQVINTLYREQLIRFDFAKGQWSWDLAGINELKITDNVVELMLDKLSQLPEDTQNILKYAACLGNRFDVNMLMTISDISPDVIGKALLPALEEELIISVHLGYKKMDALRQGDLVGVLSNNITYQFIHDRVQQGAYQGISPVEKQKTHLKIARLLLHTMNSENKNERTYMVADHYNESHELLESAERQQVIEINHQASTLSLESNAYQPMANYLTNALSLIGENGWKEDYPLTFTLNHDYALSLYLLNRIDEALELTEILLTKAQNKLDKVKVCRLQIKIYFLQGEYIKMLSIMTEALQLIGVNFVKNPTKVNILTKIMLIEWYLRRFDIDQLELQIPKATDPNIIIAMEILVEGYYYAPYISYAHGVYIIMMGVELQIKHGLCKNAAIFFTLLAIMLRFYKKPDRTFKLYNLSDRLQAHESKFFTCQNKTLYAIYICHLRHSYQEVERQLLNALNDATESGNNVAMLTAKRHLFYPKEAQGKSIVEVMDVLNLALKATLAADAKVFSELTRVQLLLTTSLSQPGGDLDQISQLETEYSALIEKDSSFETNLHWSLSRYYFFREYYDKSIYYYYLWEFKSSLVQISTLSEPTRTMNALAFLYAIPNATRRNRALYIKRIHRMKKIMQRVVNYNPENFLHLILCLQGAEAKIKGDYLQALNLFNQAIDAALKSDFYIWVAVYNELAGFMLIEQHQEPSARHYIQEASYYYNRYGMAFKVDSLRRRYPKFFNDTPVAIHSSGPSTMSTSSDKLDFLSVIKASQTISSEIILEKLFEKMLHIVMENAGAQRALFIEKRSTGMVVTAVLANHEGMDVFNNLDIPLEHYENCPKKVIQYTYRTGKPLVLNHAAEEKAYQDDPYIARHQSKSLMCLPIMQHDKVMGLIYLENNLAVGAFTQDRVIVLSTLATQMAISLENSHYITRMTQLYRSTERFVPKFFLQLLHKEHVEDVRLGDSVETQITVLFTDIRDYTTITEKQTPTEAFAFINNYLKSMGPIIRKHRGFINQYQGDAIMALFPGRPEDAVNAVLDMRIALNDYNQKQKATGQVELTVGYGLNTGLAMLGTIGEEERMDANVISDAVNLGARVESLNKFYGTKFLISDSTYQSLADKDHYLFRVIDKVQVKGKNQILQLYEVLGYKQENEALFEFVDEFNAAFNCYAKGDIETAKELFQKCLNIKPDDKSSAIFITRCNHFLEKGLPANWNAVYTQTEK